MHHRNKNGSRLCTYMHLQPAGRLGCFVDACLGIESRWCCRGPAAQRRPQKTASRCLTSPSGPACPGRPPNPTSPRRPPPAAHSVPLCRALWLLRMGATTPSRQVPAPSSDAWKWPQRRGRVAEPCLRPSMAQGPSRARPQRRSRRCRGWRGALAPATSATRGTSTSAAAAALGSAGPVATGTPRWRRRSRRSSGPRLMTAAECVDCAWVEEGPRQLRRGDRSWPARRLELPVVTGSARLTACSFRLGLRAQERQVGTVPPHEAPPTRCHRWHGSA